LPPVLFEPLQTAGFPLSTGITPLHRYYEPLLLRWDRTRARQLVGEGLPFLPFRLQGGFTIPPWLRFAKPPYNSGQPNFSGPV
jgi:hypothetical protein